MFFSAHGDLRDIRFGTVRSRAISSCRSSQIRMRSARIMENKNDFELRRGPPFFSTREYCMQSCTIRSRSVLYVRRMKVSCESVFRLYTDLYMGFLTQYSVGTGFSMEAGP